MVRFFSAIILYPYKRASDVRPYPRTELVFAVNDSIPCNNGTPRLSYWHRGECRMEVRPLVYYLAI